MAFEHLREKIVDFRKVREWEPFHNAKDLAVSISLESSELLELFQWKRTPDEINEVIKTQKEDISDEMADVLIYLINLADVADVDLEKAVLKKIEKNAKKYPADKAQGGL